MGAEGIASYPFAQSHVYDLFRDVTHAEGIAHITCLQLNDLSLTLPLPLDFAPGLTIQMFFMPSMST